jgi:hypothetical protein
MNMNDEVSFKLTPAGLAAYRKYYQVRSKRFARENPDGLNPFRRRAREGPRPKEDGRCHLLLWELLQVFGSASVFGECLFKGNEIFIVRTKKKLRQ